MMLVLGACQSGSGTDGADVGSNVSEATVESTVTLTWVVPTTNTDGTALTNLAGYDIHYGTDDAHLDQVIDVSNPEQTRYVVANLAAGTYYFDITSYTTDGVESEPSAMVSMTV